MLQALNEDANPAMAVFFASCVGKVLHYAIFVVAKTRVKEETPLPPPPDILIWHHPVFSPTKLRATVTDLSDAVRGRSFTWSPSRVDGENSSGDEELERVGLLEDFRRDSVCERTLRGGV